MSSMQRRTGIVMLLIAVAMLLALVFLPQINQLTGYAALDQEHKILIEKNMVTAVNLTSYLPGFERTYLATSASSLQVEIQDDLLVIIPDKDFVGERLISVYAAAEEVEELTFRVEVKGKPQSIVKVLEEEKEEEPEPEPEPAPEPPAPEEEPEISAVSFTLPAGQTLIVDLSQYFTEIEGNQYFATGGLNLIIDIEEDIMNITPYPGFAGEQQVTVTSAGDQFEEKLFIITVPGEAEEEEEVDEEETEEEVDEDEEAEEPAPEEVPEEVKTKEITLENKTLGKKVEDEPSFEVNFTDIAKDNETLTLVFYHDSDNDEKIYVDGDANYTLSKNLAEPYENITLTVVLDDGIVPEFELHVGETSEKFRFGKKIPKVFLKGKHIKKFKKKMLEKLKKKFGKKFRKWLRNETGYEVIDRDDDLVDIRITKHNATVYIKGVNASDIRGVFRWVSNTVLTTEIFAADPIDMEEAIITLPRIGDDVTAIVNCVDFNLSSESCPSKWITTDIPFTKTDTYINFTVDHFSGYGGGHIEVIDVQSYPTLTGNWTVRFNTTGTANLTITPIDGTNWTDYADSGYDLKLLELRCGNNAIDYTWKDDSVFVEDYNCSELGYEVSKVLTTGKHALEFRFGDDVDYAYNKVFNGVFNVSTDDNVSWYGAGSSYLGATTDWADVNGDGYADAILGAPGNSTNQGAVYILYGPLDQVTDVYVAAKANVSLWGRGGQARLGSCIGSGDLNNDGYDDLIIGSAMARGGHGDAYIIYGRSSNIPSGNISTVANATIQDTAAYDEGLGFYCDAADINGDDYDDVFVSSPGSGGDQGEVYLIYSSGTPFSGTSVIDNVYNESWFGKTNSLSYVVSRAGDVNGDGYDDVLIGAPLNGTNNPGAAYLIYGRSAPFTRQNYTLEAGVNVTFTHLTFLKYDMFGWSVSSAGDVNNDGYDDFLISAPGYLKTDWLAYWGRAYLFYGGSNSWSGRVDVLTKANATFTGRAFDQTGRAHVILGGYPIGGALSYGDFDADGYSDFLIGLYNRSASAGAVLLTYGRQTPMLGNLSPYINATIYGEGTGLDHLSGLPTGMAEGVQFEHIMLGAVTWNGTGGPPVSCPFLYTYDGSDYRLNSDLFNQGMLGVWNALGRREPFPNDYQVVIRDYIAPEDGVYKINIKETPDEVVYVDEAKLYQVDHSENTDVLTAGASWTTVFPEAKESFMTLHTVSKNPQSPASCIDNDGNDCLSKIIVEDIPVPKSESTEEFYTEEQALFGTQFKWDTLTLGLGDLSNASVIKLIINGVTYWPSISEWANDPDAEGTWPAYLQVLDENGDWINATYIPIPSGYDEKYAFEIQDYFLTNNYTIRLKIFAKSHIDYIAVDTTPDEDINLVELDMPVANLESFATGTKGFKGNITRFGDVKPLLEKTDDKFVIFIQGDQILLEFNESNVPVPGGKERDFILYTVGYFKQEKYGMNRTVEPLPFYNMSNYPYPENESYPYDEEHNAYLAEYNTRYCSAECPFGVCNDVHNSDEGKVYIMNGEQQLTCGNITSSVEMSMDLTTAADCFKINADDITVDCAGYKIIGNNTGRGVISKGYTGVTVTNCIFVNFTNDILFSNTNDSVIDSTDVIINITNSNGDNVTDSNITELYVTDSTNIQIINCTTANYTLDNVTVFTVEDLTYGSIRFLESITANGTIMDTDISTTDNKAFVNSSGHTGLNVSANITLKGLSFASTPNIFADRNDDGQYEEQCVAPVCSNLSYAAGTFVFNVSYFTSYTSNTSMPPVQGMPILNSTFKTNRSHENLTVYPQNVQDPAGLSVKNITNWYLNGGAIAILNMPFEGGSNSTYTKDYSGGNRNGVVGGAVWSNSSGYDGWGSYLFDGSAYHINLTGAGLDLQYDLSIAAWVNLSDLSGVKPIVVKQTTIMMQKSPYYFKVNNANLSFSYTSGLAGGTVTSAAVFNQTDKWYFVAVTRDYVGTKLAGNSTIKLFVDGQLVKTGLLIGFPEGGGIVRIGTDALGTAFFNGSMDEVQIYNKTLTEQQINLMYAAGASNYQKIHSSELVQGQVWEACLTPNNRILDGATKCSNNLTIRNGKPTASPVLNTTTGFNGTNEDLLLNPNVTDKDGSHVKNITNWYMNGTSIMVLNMPFEIGSNGSWTKDYSSFENNGTVSGAVWNDTGGYDGWGAYNFPNNADYINCGNDASLNIKGPITVSAWIKPTANLGTYKRIVEKDWAQSYILNSKSGTNGIAFCMDSDGNPGNYVQTADNVIPLNSWTHVVGTWDGSELRIYLNGTLNASKNYSVAVTGSANNVFIGKYSGGVGNSFPGWIDEVQIYNRSLSAQQVLALYNRQSKMVSQETITGETWKACVTPIDSELEGDTSCSNNLTVKGNVLLNPILNSTYGTNGTDENLTVYPHTQPGAITNITTWYRNGTSITVLNMPFDTNDAVSAKDYSTYKNLGAVQNATWTSSGISGGAYSFNGVNATIQVPDSASLSPNETVTVEGWFYYTSIGRNSGLIWKHSYNYILYTGEAGLVKFNVWNSSGAMSGASFSENLLAAPGWNHIVGVFDGTKSILYLNGTQTGTNGSVIGGGIRDQAGNLFIGKRGDNVGLAYFNGTIDEVRIYNRTLSAQQIKSNYNAGSSDYRRITSDETVAGDVWKACVTPNNAQQDFQTKCSNNVTTLPYGYCPGHETDGMLVVDANYVTTKNIICKAITVNNSANLSINSAGAGNKSILIQAENITIAAGSKINAKGYGYSGGDNAHTNGYGPGGGAGVNYGVYGLAAGGGHGGIGGYAGSSIPGGKWYGSSFNPVLMGSGGGSPGSIYDGGDGGGAIKINATKNLIINGQVNADGKAPTGGVCSSSYPRPPGGGAAGSIWITANYLTGAGNISAIGGNGWLCAGVNLDGGAGGGGHVLVFYNASSWSTNAFLKSSVAGGLTSAGSGNAANGSAGTLAFVDLNKNNIFITDGFKWLQSDFNIDTSYFNWTNFTMFEAVNVKSNMTSALQLNVSNFIHINTTIWNGSANDLLFGPAQDIFVVDSNLFKMNTVTLNAPPVMITNSNISCHPNNGTNQIWMSATNITLNNNAILQGSVNATAVNITIGGSCMINATGYGYSGGNNAHTNGYGPGGGTGVNYGSFGYGAGGGHGGIGGYAGSSIPGGKWYGSSFNPVLMGSGGGCPGASQYGGAGGGMVLFNVDNLILNGRVIADGSYPPKGVCSPSYPRPTGGGAGGYVLINTKTLAGTGNFSADGGNGYICAGVNPDGGAGGGGHVIVYYNTATWGASDFLRSSAAKGLTDAGSGNAKDGATGTLAFVDLNKNNIFITDGFKWTQSDLNANSSWFNWVNLTIYQADNVKSNMTTALQLNVSNELNITDSIWNSSRNDLITSPATITIENSNIFKINNLMINAPPVYIINSTVESYKNNGSNQLHLTATTAMIQNNSEIIGNVNFTVTTLTITKDSIVNASGYGYSGGTSTHLDGYGPGGGKGYNAGTWGLGGGGAHGGSGGDGWIAGAAADGGTWYGSSFNPVLMGSGGGSPGAYVGGDGGGMVLFNANNLIFDGRITADGSYPPSGFCSGTNPRPTGGGAGGMVFINTHILNGTGNISADGGDGWNCSGANYDGGAGGGGRAAVYYNITPWTLTDFFRASAAKGLAARTSANAVDGKEGTIAFIDNINQDVFVVRNFRFQSNDATGGYINYHTVNSTSSHVEFNDSAILNLSGSFNLMNSNLTDNGSITVNIRAQNIFFDENATINVSGRLALAYDTFSDTKATYIDGMGLTLGKRSLSEIAWRNSSLKNLANLSASVKPGNNSAFSNSSALPSLNQSANITFFNVNLLKPYPLVDFEDDGTFIPCAVCKEISHVGTTYNFNTTRFSNFTLGENYTYPNQTTPVLQSSAGGDTTNENLTVYPQNVTGEPNATLTNITDWFVNNDSLMVLKMPFNTNSSTVAKDYSPYKNNGTVINATWTSLGISGGAYSFDGAGDFINISDNSSLDFGTRNFTVCAWANNTNNGNIEAMLFAKSGNNPASTGWFMRTDTNSYTAQVRNGVNANCILSPAGRALSGWHYFCLRRNSTTMTIFVDGSSDSVVNNADCALSVSNTADVLIGTKNVGWHGGADFNGTIDEVRIYNRSLSAQQIAANYNNGTPNYNTIVSQETVVNETWHACVVINDGLVDSIELCSNNITILAPSAGPVISTTYPDISVLNFKTDRQSFEGRFETLKGNCTNCSYDSENVCQLEQEVITGGVGPYNMSLFLNGSAVSMQKMQLICMMYDYAVNVLGGPNCTGSNDNNYTCANWVGGGTNYTIDLTNSSNFNTSVLLGNISPTNNCSTVVCYMQGEWVPGDNQSFSINKQFTVYDATNNATNPNGTLTFTTDKYVGIETLAADINILNMQLDFQHFNGTFDTTTGACSNCSFDGGNIGWCQAEVEKVFGMFQSYNLTINLTTPTPINITNLQLVCRSFNETVAINSNCSGLSPHADSATGCFSPVATPGKSSVVGNTLYINLTGFTNLSIPMGTISPTASCKQVACELTGTWTVGDSTQQFVINKSITVSAI